MKKINKAICFFVVSFYLFSFAQAATVKTSELLPPDTVFVAEVKDFSQLKSQLEKTSVYRLYKDPSMAAFIENVKKGLNEKVQKLDDNNIYKVFYQSGLLPEGKFAVALILNEKTKESEELPLVFITQWGEKIEKVKEVVKKLVEKNTEMGGYSKGSEEYSGVSIETTVDEVSAELSYCFVDDYFMASFGGSDVVKFIIAQLKGSSSLTLADEGDYSSAISASGPHDDAVFYFNIKKVVDTEIAEDTSGEAKEYINKLGLDNVRCFCCSVGLARLSGGFSCAKALLKIDGAKAGICRILELESAVVRAPGFLSSSTYSAVFVNLNVKAAFDELVKVVSSFSAGAGSVFYTPILPPSPDGEPGLELKRDIIEHLGSQIIITSDVERPITGTSTQPNGLFALATTNSRALENSLSTIHSKFIAPNKPETRVEILGHTIYLIDLSSFFLFGPAQGNRVPLQGGSSGAGSQMPKLAFTVAETHLVFGTQASVERAIRTLDSAAPESMESSKWFSAAKAAIPSVVGLAILEDRVTSSEIAWKSFEKLAKSADKSMDGQSEVSVGLGLGSGLVPSPMISESGPFDFGLLPEFDVISKYFGLWAFYGISRPDGFFFGVKEVAKPGE